MRYKTKFGKNKELYDNGARTRIKYRFLYLPKRIKYEWRWLEMAMYKEELIYEPDGHDDYTSWDAGYAWVSTEWINNPNDVKDDPNLAKSLLFGSDG